MKERPILFSPPMVRALLAGTKTQTRRIVNMDRLRVRLPRRVVSDWLPGDEPLIAEPGVYRATIHETGAVSVLVEGHPLGVKPGEFHFVCPYADGDTHLGDFGAAGKKWVVTPRESRLWVRERWAPVDHLDRGYDLEDPVSIGYAADRAAICHEKGNVHSLDTYAWNWDCVKWRPSIFMRRWACRLLLDVTVVRAERLQDITAEDVIAEGIDPAPHRCDCEACARTSTICPASSSSLIGEYAGLWDSLNAARAPWASNRWVWVVSFKRVTP